MGSMKDELGGRKSKRPTKVCHIKKTNLKITKTV